MIILLFNSYVLNFKNFKCFHNVSGLHFRAVMSKYFFFLIILKNIECDIKNKICDQVGLEPRSSHYSNISPSLLSIELRRLHKQRLLQCLQFPFVLLIWSMVMITVQPAMTVYNFKARLKTSLFVDVSLV